MDSKLFVEKCKKIGKVLDKELTDKQRFFFFAINDDNNGVSESIEHGTNLTPKMLVHDLEEIIKLLKSDPNYKKSPYCLCCRVLEVHE